ncbi:target of Nesh-SH3 isoform X2 [Neolamprologus brichardi]|uniref:target of Nesh-SH3 isoform X2 n=1 Tax=Neolamprologus brichardi TaxID=32507 RepID=UPI0003EBEB31|nr:target of Nesh-SH3 isoform X2 [Neolamprologus brichardi]
MMKMQQHSHIFLSLILAVFIFRIALSGRSVVRVRRQNMKVRISTTGDTIVMKFLRPNTDTRLEGYILGYGGSMFSKQFIQLPEDGKPYETEFDAEPKYLIAVQPIPANEVKKQCTGKVELQKPLHLVIGSVTPTSVLLSWGTLLKTPYEGNIMNDCLEDGHYTVRYREKNRKWNYQTCPTSDTVIDKLKPNTVYEFGVQPNSKDGTGVWSRPVVHNISMPGVEEKVIRKIFRPPVSPAKPLPSGPHSLPSFPHLTSSVQNKTRGRLPLSRNIAAQTTLAPTTTTTKTTTTTRETLSTPGPAPAVINKQPIVLRPPVSGNKKPNLVGKPSSHDKLMDLKQGEKASILKPFPLVTARPKQEPKQQTTTTAPALNTSRFDIYENSSIFRPLPKSEVDSMGNPRFIAPHVIYKTDKPPEEPCSITSSLAYFPDEEGSDQNVTGPPRLPPSNVTVVTVEGCPSFVILDWQKTDNETREYEVVSTTTGPNGRQMSVLTTNQTHTAVENLKPESSYEFTVTPRNELGTGPSSDPVTFSTESADPRVSEYVSGKDAIWTQFPFKADAYSECNGKQFVKRTWYRKFVGIQLCNSLRYKIYLSETLNGKFYNIGDQTGYGEDHCQFVDSFLDGKTGSHFLADQLQSRQGFYRALRQEPVSFGEIGGKSHATYVGWYECGTPIPGKW